MTPLQKAGGIAALLQALTYIVGFAAIATVLDPGNTEQWSALQKLEYTLDRKWMFQLWTLFIYVVFGIALVVLSVALHDRLRVRSPAMAQVATAFGLIWAGLAIASGMVASVGLETVDALHARDNAQAASAWIVIGAIQNGLGGGVEIVGGLWVLLTSVAALQDRQLPKALNYLGIAIGIAGVLTLVPPLAELGAVFGLGQIIWFAWLGVHMLRRVGQVR